MKTRSVEALSEAECFGKSKVTWDIVDWNGPMSHFMRSKAECFVNVPVTEKSSQDIKLRFHIEPYKNQRDPQLKFCKTTRQFCGIHDSCCYPCKPVPRGIADIPEKLWPENIPRSSGYSLLLDILNAPTDSMALNISVEKVNNKKIHGPKNNLVILEPNSPRQNISAVKNIWRTVIWTMDKSGKMDNCESIYNNKNDRDISIQLTVKAYKMRSTGTDTASAEKLRTRKVCANAKQVVSSFPKSIPKVYKPPPSQLNLLRYTPVQVFPPYQIEDHGKPFEQPVKQVPSSATLSGCTNFPSFSGTLNSEVTDFISIQPEPLSRSVISNLAENTATRQQSLSKSTEVHNASSSQELGQSLSKLSLASEPASRDNRSSGIFYFANCKTGGLSASPMVPKNYSTKPFAFKFTDSAVVSKNNTLAQPCHCTELKHTSPVLADKRTSFPKDDVQSSSYETLSDSDSEFEPIY